jgi:hypothetical protein
MVVEFRVNITNGNFIVVPYSLIVVLFVRIFWDSEGLSGARLIWS